MRLIIEGFKSTVLFDKDHVDERIIADTIKAHMTQMKQPPLIGQDVMGVNDGRAVKLGYVLTPEMIEKLGKFKVTYESCVSAQKRFDLACAKYDRAEKQFGKINKVQTKLNKVQGTITTCSNTVKQIETAFKNLDSEFQAYMQEQTANEIPVLKSTACNNKPLMDTLSISELTEILLKCQQKLKALVEQRFEISVMSKVIGQVVKEMTNIRNSMDNFQSVEVLEQIMKDLRKGLFDANTLLYGKKVSH